MSVLFDVLVGLEDLTVPYESARSKLANLVKFKTCTKAYETGNLVNFANLVNFFRTSVRRRNEEGSRF